MCIWQDVFNVPAPRETAGDAGAVGRLFRLLSSVAAMQLAFQQGGWGGGEQEVDEGRWRPEVVRSWCSFEGGKVDDGESR